jgi:hypothetical protein
LEWELEMEVEVEVEVEREMDVESITYIHCTYLVLLNVERSVSVTNFFLRVASWSCCEFVPWYCMRECIYYCDGK